MATFSTKEFTISDAGAEVLTSNIKSGGHDPDLPVDMSTFDGIVNSIIDSTQDVQIETTVEINDAPLFKSAIVITAGIGYEIKQSLGKAGDIFDDDRDADQVNIISIDDETLCPIDDEDCKLTIWSYTN